MCISQHVCFFCVLKAMQARFDFTGTLIPPSEDLPTHLGLHHHGDEPEVCGIKHKMNIFICVALTVTYGFSPSEPATPCRSSSFCLAVSSSSKEVWLSTLLPASSLKYKNQHMEWLIPRGKPAEIQFYFLSCRRKVESTSRFWKAAWRPRCSMPVCSSCSALRWTTASKEWCLQPCMHSKHCLCVQKMK